MPPQYLDRFVQIYPFGIAGSYIRCTPTFVSAESALDAGPDETPPADAFYCHPDNQPNPPHDDVTPETGIFVIQEILREPWQP